MRRIGVLLARVAPTHALIEIHPDADAAPPAVGSTLVLSPGGEDEEAVKVLASSDVGQHWRVHVVRSRNAEYHDALTPVEAM